MICSIFKRSPVFRIDGDEFAVISQGSDYDHIEELLGNVNEHNAEALQEDGIVVACGMAKCLEYFCPEADNVKWRNPRLKTKTTAGVLP